MYRPEPAWSMADGIFADACCGFPVEIGRIVGGTLAAAAAYWYGQEGPGSHPARSGQIVSEPLRSPRERRRVRDGQAPCEGKAGTDPGVPTLTEGFGLRPRILAKQGRPGFFAHPSCHIDSSGRTRPGIGGLSVARPRLQRRPGACLLARGLPRVLEREGIDAT